MQSIKRDHLGPIMLDHSPQAHLPGRIPNDLCQSCSRNDDLGAFLYGGSEN